MLPKRRRIADSKKILYIIRKGRKTINGSISFYILDEHYNGEPQDSQLAIIISGKVTKKSVTRNKLRRQIFSIFEQYPLKNKSIVIRLLPGADKYDFEQIKVRLDKSL